MSASGFGSTDSVASCGTTSPLLTNTNVHLRVKVFKSDNYDIPSDWGKVLRKYKFSPYAFGFTTPCHISSFICLLSIPESQYLIDNYISDYCLKKEVFKSMRFKRAIIQLWSKDSNHVSVIVHNVWLVWGHQQIMQSEGGGEWVSKRLKKIT